ncbi:MAG: hypothetical protein ACRCZB_09160, partial [Bacteroidales bacterium]
ENYSIPAEKKTIPAENYSIPAEKKTNPAENYSTPAKKKTTPKKEPPTISPKTHPKTKHTPITKPQIPTQHNPYNYLKYYLCNSQFISPSINILITHNQRGNLTKASQKQTFY